MLNLRETPSIHARVVAQLATGTRVSVISRDGTWTHVQAGPYYGHVLTSYLVFDGGAPAPQPPVLTPDANATVRTSNGGSLNLRSWSSSSAPVLGSFSNGTRVRVLSRGDSWSRVQVGASIGYMSSKYLSFDGGGGGGGGGTPSWKAYDAVVSNPGAGQSLNLRAQPSTSSRSIGQYYSGTPLKVLGVGTEWLRVNVGGIEGYMMAKYVYITSAGATPHKTVTGGANGYVNLRSGAGYNYTVLQRVSNGAAASVVIPYPAWSRVLVRQGSGFTAGYMLNSFLH